MPGKSPERPPHPHTFHVGNIGSGNRVQIGENLTYIENYVSNPITTPDELDQVDPSIRAELATRYQEEIRKSPDNARYHLALGLYYLDLRNYSYAIRSLQIATERSPFDANAFYYLALAHLNGKRPRFQKMSTIKTIDNLLNTALQIDSRPCHYLYLWAMIKYDYYLGNGFLVSPPAISDLIYQADRGNFSENEFSHMCARAAITPQMVGDMIEDYR